MSAHQSFAGRSFALLLLSFLSDLDQEDENMSKPKGTDDADEHGLEDAHNTHTWAWFGMDLKEC